MQGLKKLTVAVFAVCLLATAAQADLVTTTGADGYGASSFISAGVWSDGLAPHSGADYLIDDEDRVRTPGDSGSYVFGGDSLTVSSLGSGSNLYLMGLTYKGIGTTGMITVDNLILDGGAINHLNGQGDYFQLYGNLNVASDSFIYAKQGPIYLYSTLSGSAQITIPASDATACKVWIGATASNFAGNIVNHGRFGLLENGVLNFVIGANGVNNSISDGGSQQHTTLDGKLIFDLSGAGTTLGDSCTVIGTTPGSTYYGTAFYVPGFINAGDNDTWFKQIDASSFYVFQQSTGTLTVAPTPEPATMILVAFGGLALLRRRV